MTNHLLHYRSVCAIIVTYNRLSLLKECINAIENQTYSCDFYVVNNNSSDNTESYLNSKNINHFTTDCNIGGAGGFNLGIKNTINKDYDYLWLMDDDCIPNRDALEKLINASNLLENDFGFLSSKVLWIDNSINKMNEANLKKPYNILNSIYFVKQATFVSLLIKSETIRQFGLPIKDFFIWGDDIEFTRRIAVINKIDSYHIDNSVVIHKTKNNHGSKIAYDSIENISRYEFAYRNEFFLYKNEGVKGVVYYICKCCFNFLRILFFAKNNRVLRIKTLLRGFIKGISFNPKIEYL